jgi:hypothetical protein
MWRPQGNRQNRKPTTERTNHWLIGAADGVHYYVEFARPIQTDLFRSAAAFRPELATIF